MTRRSHLSKTRGPKECLFKEPGVEREVCGSGEEGKGQITLGLWALP